jgi:hypothetical protein
LRSSEGRTRTIIERRSGASSRAELAFRSNILATLSHHPKELQNAGLVVGRKEVQAMFLSFRADVL